MVIFADCASLDQIATFVTDQRIVGYTTNPSLMRKSGVTNYRAFAKSVLDIIGQKIVSFEVLADDEDGMYRQAMEIAAWGGNIYVKIPTTYCDGTFTDALTKRLVQAGVKLNITAVMTTNQIKVAFSVLKGDHILSIFAGRIADTCEYPRNLFMFADKWRPLGVKLLWASTRQAFSVLEAEKAKADIITLTPELIAKLAWRGRDLAEFSLETVRQFHEDGKGIEF